MLFVTSVVVRIADEAVEVLNLAKLPFLTFQISM